MSKLDQSLRKLNRQLEAIGAVDVTKALEAAGDVLQAESQRRAPVDTGDLRISARTDVVDDHVEVSFNTNYAYYQEMGTEKMPAHPYVRPAIDEEGDKIVAAAGRQLQKDIKGAI